MNQPIHDGIAAMATDLLTLDALMDVLCDYRQTVGGDCPIAIQYGDSGGYAVAAGLIHATYLEQPEAPQPGVAPLLRLVTLGADLSGYADPPRLALCLRPQCPSDNALEIAR